MKGKVVKMDKKFIEALGGLPIAIKQLLKNIPENMQKKVTEICLRADKPLIISTFDGAFFITKSGEPIRSMGSSVRVITKLELDECVHILTEYSIHSFKDNINMGFITINGGHRAGIVGSCVLSDGKIIAITDFSSINLRIARQVRGVADDLVRSLYSEGVCGTLIVGCPSSGKTTLLRDISYQLASGVGIRLTKLSMVDERGELASMKSGIPQNDVGICCDVLDGYKKGEGMTIAIRTMSPKAIILDEIGTFEDAESIKQGINAGVCVIATTHANTLEELSRKKHIYSLIEEGAFEYIVLLSGADKPCQIKSITKSSEVQRIYEGQKHPNHESYRKGFVACIN